MFKVAIVTSLTDEQLEYVKNLATEKGIDAYFVVENEQRSSSTPITGAMMDEIAQTTGQSAIKVLTELAFKYKVKTIEEALSHDEVPLGVKALLENYL